MPTVPLRLMRGWLRVAQMLVLWLISERSERGFISSGTAPQRLQAWNFFCSSGGTGQPSLPAWWVKGGGEGVRRVG